MVVLVDISLAGVDEHAGLVGAVLCVVAAGGQGLGISQEFGAGEKAFTAEGAAVEGEVGDGTLLSAKGDIPSGYCCVLLSHLPALEVST